MTQSNNSIVHSVYLIGGAGPWAAGSEPASRVLFDVNPQQELTLNRSGSRAPGGLALQSQSYLCQSDIYQNSLHTQNIKCDWVTFRVS